MSHPFFYPFPKCKYHMRSDMSISYFRSDKTSHTCYVMCYLIYYGTSYVISYGIWCPIFSYEISYDIFMLVWTFLFKKSNIFTDWYLISRSNLFIHFIWSLNVWIIIWKWPCLHLKLQSVGPAKYVWEIGLAPVLEQL